MTTENTNAKIINISSKIKKLPGAGGQTRALIKGGELDDNVIQQKLAKKGVKIGLKRIASIRRRLDGGASARGRLILRLDGVVARAERALTIVQSSDAVALAQSMSAALTALRDAQEAAQELPADWKPKHVERGAKYTVGMRVALTEKRAADYTELLDADEMTSLVIVKIAAKRLVCETSSGIKLFLNAAHVMPTPVATAAKPSKKPSKK